MILVCKNFVFVSFCDKGVWIEVGDDVEGFVGEEWICFCDIVDECCWILWLMLVDVVEMSCWLSVCVYRCEGWENCG